MPARQLDTMLLLNQQNVDSFLLLPTTTLNKASRKLNITYCYAHKIKNIFVKKQLLVQTRNGRENIIAFTNKGRNLATILILAKSNLQDNKIQWK